MTFIVSLICAVLLVEEGDELVLVSSALGVTMPYFLTREGESAFCVEVEV